MFQHFATIYDTVMDERLYEDWLAVTDQLVQRYLPSNLWHQDQNGQMTLDLLDLACGTGELLKRFDQNPGYQVDGLDLSGEMLEVARSKQAATFKGDLLQADMKDLSQVSKAYQVVTCFSDSMCYLTQEGDWPACFASIFRVLQPGGLLIFDCHSLFHLHHHLNGFSYHYAQEDFAFLWDSALETEQLIQHQLTFFIRDKQGLFQRLEETHRERTYEPGQIQAWLEQAGFVHRLTFADFDLSQQTSESLSTSERLFFLAQKPMAVS